MTTKKTLACKCHPQKLFKFSVSDYYEIDIHLSHVPYSNYSDNIQKVRKERVFEEDVTEKEMDIIQQRIAFQQRQVRHLELSHGLPYLLFYSNVRLTRSLSYFTMVVRRL